MVLDKALFLVSGAQWNGIGDNKFQMLRRNLLSGITCVMEVCVTSKHPSIPRVSYDHTPVVTS